MATIQRIRTVFTGVAGGPWYNNLYVTATESDAQAEINIIDNFWESLKGSLNNAVSWVVEGTVANVNIATGVIESASANDPQGGTGTAAGDQMPSACQVLVRFRTGVYVGGRELRGRLFLPGQAEAENSDGLVSSTLRTLVQEKVDDFLLGSDATALNGALNVWSRTHGVVAIVNNASVWEQWAVLRSRRD